MRLSALGTFTPLDATAAVLSFSANGVPGRAALIGIASAAGICPLLKGGKEPRSTDYLVLTAFRLQPDYSAAPPPSPGTYYVGSLAIENGVVAFAATDATCHLVGTRKRRLRDRSPSPRWATVTPARTISRSISANT